MLLCQIQLKEIFETDTDIALVLELVTGGELFDRWEPSPASTQSDIITPSTPCPPPVC